MAVDALPNAEAIERGIEAIQNDILADLDAMTMKKARAMLEKHLKLADGALKAVKSQVSSAVDQLLASNKAAPASQPEAAEADAATATNEAAASDSFAEDSAMEDAEDSTPEAGQRKRKRKQKKVADADGTRSKKRQKGSKGKPKATAAADTGSKKANKQLEVLKAICSKAGIKVSPNVYKQKDDNARISAVEALLERHGLSRHSSHSEITAMKKKLEREKDLEGIEMDNIVSGPRRGRQEAAAKLVSYRAAVDSDNSDADSDLLGGGEDDDEDASVSGDSDAEASAGMGDDGDKPASEDETSAQQDADSGASEGAASPAADDDEDDSGSPLKDTPIAAGGKAPPHKRQLISDSDDD